MRMVLPFLALAALSACGPGGGDIASASSRPAPYVPVPGQAPNPPGPPGVLVPVQGQNATALLARFGPARMDTREGNARKLQFAGAICVLDIYLYPRARGEAVGTYVDARQRSGAPIDPASCVAALQRSR